MEVMDFLLYKLIYKFYLAKIIRLKLFGINFIHPKLSDSNYLVKILRILLLRSINAVMLSGFNGV